MALTQTQERHALLIQPEPLVNRQWLYPGLLAVFYVVWFSAMIIGQHWGLYEDYWQAALTMSLGSFVAGATAEGGAAIAFPVFTKVLHIPASDARTFGLMIQSVGMTMAGVMIYSQRVKVLWGVIFWVSLAGVLGQILGTYVIHIPLPYPKILFTFVTTTFGIALIISRWVLTITPREALRWDHRLRAVFLMSGLLGGLFAANTGSGIDTLTFIILTLAFGINEKISTPTTVIIMAINSIVGFFLHAVVSQDIGMAFNYWMVALPVVVLGAPMGAFAAARAKRDHIITLLLVLISIELVSTLILVKFTGTSILITAVAMLIAAVFFAVMLRYRQRELGAL